MMKTELEEQIFHSIEELWEKYFPEATREDEIEGAPSEFGSKLAARVIEILKRELHK